MRSSNPPQVITLLSQLFGDTVQRVAAGCTVNLRCTKAFASPDNVSSRRLEPIDCIVFPFVLFKGLCATLHDGGITTGGL